MLFLFIKKGELGVGVGGGGGGAGGGGLMVLNSTTTQSGSRLTRSSNTKSKLLTMTASNVGTGLAGGEISIIESNNNNSSSVGARAASHKRSRSPLVPTNNSLLLNANTIVDQLNSGGNYAAGKNGASSSTASSSTVTAPATATTASVVASATGHRTKSSISVQPIVNKASGAGGHEAEPLAPHFEMDDFLMAGREQDPENDENERQKQQPRDRSMPKRKRLSSNPDQQDENAAGPVASASASS